MTATNPTLDAVLESFLLEADTHGSLATYVQRFPQFALELVDLSHEARRTPADDPRPLDAAAMAAIHALTNDALAAWPSDGQARNLFADLRPADYGRISSVMGVPRGVIGAIKEGLAIWASIPQRWLARLADALGGSVEDLRGSVGYGRTQASFKSEVRPERREPVTFEQLLKEARVDGTLIARIMEDID